jgi:hypothetical protein
LPRRRQPVAIITLPAESTQRQHVRGRDRACALLRRCGPPAAVRRPASAEPGTPHRSLPGDIRSALEAANRSCMVEISTTSPSPKRQTAKSRTSTGLPVTLTPHIAPACVPRQMSSVVILSRAENIYLMVVVRSGSPLAVLAFWSSHADKDSIGSDVPTEQVVDQRGIPRPSLGGQRRTISMWRSLSAWSAMPCLPGKRFKACGDGSAPSTVLLTLPPCQRFFPWEQACRWRPTGPAIPARSGRSGRWPAVPSRCPTRGARPRHGP